MSAENSAGESEASPPADPAPATAAAADESPFHALAVAADPVLAGLWGANQPQPEFDGGMIVENDAQAYDGHVALALDLGPQHDMASTLDLLITSHDLFDIPAMDIGAGSDDTTPT